MTAKNTPSPPKIYGDSLMRGIPVLVKSNCMLSLADETNHKPIAIQIKKIPLQIPKSCILIISSISYLQIKQIQQKPTLDSKNNFREDPETLQNHNSP